VIRYRIEFILFQIFKWLVLALPLKSAQRLGFYIGSLGFYLSPGRRRVAIENLHLAFPDKSDEECISIARGSFRNFGISFIELLWFPNLNDKILRKLIKPHNLELLNNRFSEGKGLVVLSGHFGNWELIALGMSYFSKIPFTIIIQKQNNIFVDEVINQHRCLFGNKVVPMGLSVREIIKTLQNGGIVAIAPDQSGDKDHGIYIEFFGSIVATHQGPAVFALRSGAPLLIGYMIRQQDGTYDVYLEEIQTKDLTGSTEENIRELTRRHLGKLEQHIRQHPDHWLWMHRRWKHTLKNVEP